MCVSLMRLKASAGLGLRSYQLRNHRVGCGMRAVERLLERRRAAGSCFLNARNPLYVLGSASREKNFTGMQLKCNSKNGPKLSLIRCVKKIQQQTSEAPSQRNVVALRRLCVGAHAAGRNTHAPSVRTSAVPEGYRRYLSVHETRVPDPDQEEKSNADP